MKSVYFNKFPGIKGSLFSLNIKLADIDILDLCDASKIVCPKKSRILSCGISTTKHNKVSGLY